MVKIIKNCCNMCESLATSTIGKLQHSDKLKLPFLNTNWVTKPVSICVHFCVINCGQLFVSSLYTLLASKLVKYSIRNKAIRTLNISYLLFPRTTWFFATLLMFTHWLACFWVMLSCPSNRDHNCLSESWATAVTALTPIGKHKQ